MAQSPECPWTVGPAGPVDIRLDIPGDALVQAGTVAADVDVLVGYLGGLLADTEVTVERQAMHRPPCDPDIVDDRLPVDGVVLRILRACARAGWRPDICATSRPDPVWHVPDAAAANKVRVKHRMGGYPSSSFWDEYRAVDARRVADEIAAGTAMTEPSWRTDTDEGRHARTAFTESRASRRGQSP